MIRNTFDGLAEEMKSLFDGYVNATIAHREYNNKLQKENELLRDAMNTVKNNYGYHEFGESCDEEDCIGCRTLEKLKE